MARGSRIFTPRAEPRLFVDSFREFCLIGEVPRVVAAASKRSGRPWHAAGWPLARLVPRPEPWIGSASKLTPRSRCRRVRGYCVRLPGDALKEWKRV